MNKAFLLVIELLYKFQFFHLLFVLNYLKNHQDFLYVQMYEKILTLSNIIFSFFTHQDY